MWKHLLILTIVSCCVGQSENEIFFCTQDAPELCLCLYIDNRFLSLKVDCHARNLTEIDVNMRLPEFTEIFDLSVNNLQRIPHVNVSAGSSLYMLLLNNNKIANIEASAFDGVSTLKVLDLSDNLLEKLDPGIFHGIFKLEYLDLSRNRLTSFESGMFLYLPKLRGLNLGNNYLGKFLENATDIFANSGLAINPKIENLELENVGLIRFRDDYFKSAYNLRKIILAHNSIDSIPRLPHTTEYLDISSTLITTIGPVDFNNLPAISHLVANNMTRLTSIQNHTFYVLRNLQQLSLENCIRLKTFNPYAFGIGMGDDTNYEFTLKHISFLGSGLRTLDERLSPYFARLSSLDLRSNPWKCDCNLRWISKLQIDEKHKEFIRCLYPAAVRFHMLYSLKDDEFVCQSNFEIAQRALINCLIFFCVLMSFFALYLVFIWPRSKQNKVGPEPYYTRVTINPNNAEDI